MTPGRRPHLSIPWAAIVAQAEFVVFGTKLSKKGGTPVAGFGPAAPAAPLPGAVHI